MRGEKDREARKKEREADQGSWEILQAERQQIKPEWRTKIVGGHRVTFVLDSGAVRTISPPGAVPGVEVYQTKLTGKNFRSASGHLIPNLGEAEVKGSVMGQKTAFKSQVADITKPLASTNEMVDGGNVIIMHKAGGMIKRVSASTEADILNYIKGVLGESIPVTRRGGAFVNDVEVQERKNISADGFITPSAKKTVKKSQGVQPMERDLCDDGLNQWKHIADECCTESRFQRRV